jgi:hypothetical protein
MSDTATETLSAVASVVVAGKQGSQLPGKRM